MCFHSVLVRFSKSGVWSEDVFSWTVCRSMEHKFNEIKTLAEDLKIMDSVPLSHRAKFHNDIVNDVLQYISNVCRGFELVQTPFSEDVAEEVQSLNVGFMYDKEFGFGVLNRSEHYHTISNRVGRYHQYLGVGRSYFPSNCSTFIRENPSQLPQDGMYA